MQETTRNPVGQWTPFFIMLLMYFIIGLYTVINQQFQVPLKAAMLPHDGNITNALVTLLNFSWFLSYPLSEGFATRWLEKFGYRRTTIYALLILIAGLLVYELAVWMHTRFPQQITILGNRLSFGFFIFLAGSFIVGVATAVLQVILNLYLTVCPVGNTTSLQRQMIGGTVNSVGMAIAPLVVSTLIFSGVALPDVNSGQFVLPLLWMTVVMVLVAFGTNRVQMPEVTIRPEEEAALHQNIWSFRRLRLGVVAIFFYVGIEVAVGANINMYAIERGGGFASQATHMAALYWFLLLVGRLIGSFLKNVPSQLQLVVSSIGASLFLLLAVWLSNPWILAGTGLFHSIMWPAIFTLAVDGLGKYTAKASGLLMIGVLGGGVIPFLQGIAADLSGGAWRWTWLIVLVGEAFIFYYGTSGYKIPPQEQE